MASRTQEIVEQTKALGGLLQVMGAVVALSDQMQRSARQGSGLTGGSKIATGSIAGRSNSEGSSGSANSRAAFKSLGF